MSIISGDELLRLYHINCLMGDCGKQKELLWSYYLMNMYHNGTVPNNIKDIMDVAVVNKFIGNKDNKNLLNSLFALSIINPMFNNVKKGGSQRNIMNDFSQFVQELNMTNFSGGGKKNNTKTNIKDMIVFGGKKQKNEDSISGVSTLSGGQTVCPSSYPSESISQSNDVQSYTSTDYSYNTYNSGSQSTNTISQSDTLSRSLDSNTGSQLGGRILDGCQLGDKSMNCMENVNTVDSPMNLGNALNVDSLTKNGGGNMEGSTVTSTCKSNGEGMESQSVWSQSEMSNNLSTQSGGSHLTGSTLGSISTSNGQATESQSVWSESNMKNNLQTQAGGRNRKYNVRMEFKKK